MSPLLPLIYRDCRRLLVFNESVVQRFSLHHKYTVQQYFFCLAVFLHFLFAACRQDLRKRFTQTKFNASRSFYAT